VWKKSSLNGPKEAGGCILPDARKPKWKSRLKRFAWLGDLYAAVSILRGVRRAWLP